MTKIGSLVITALLIMAAPSWGQDLGEVNAEVRAQIGASLTAYLGVKDALVDSDVNAASVRAEELVKAVDAVDASKMSDAQKTQWEKLGPRIRTDASHINKNKDLAHQREHLMKLSNNMYALVHGFKANGSDVYLFYCPMKKATWLSESKDVRNPYYGKRMLDCGSIRTTLKK